MGFIYSGISSQSRNISAHLTNWQVSPALRNSYISVPGKSGVADFGCDSAERNLIVMCNVFPQKDFAAMVAVLDGVAEWLDPVMGLKMLIFDDVPDRYYTARLSEAVDCERLLRAAGAFELRFVCPDPYAYALTDEVFNFTETGESDFVRLIGSAESEPVYSLKGVVTSGVSSYISIQTNSRDLQVVGPLFNGETLIIDAGKITAKVVDETGGTLRNGLPLLRELNFPVLQKGLNNVNINAVNSTFTELKIEAKSRWR